MSKRRTPFDGLDEAARRMRAVTDAERRAGPQSSFDGPPVGAVGSHGFKMGSPPGAVGSMPGPHGFEMGSPPTIPLGYCPERGMQPTTPPSTMPMWGAVAGAAIGALFGFVVIDDPSFLRGQIEAYKAMQKSGALDAILNGSIADIRPRKPKKAAKPARRRPVSAPKGSVQ